MILILLQHQWKSFWRSRSAGRNVAMQIIIGFFVLYIIGIAILLGFSLDKLLSEAAPGKDIIQVFLGIILYYFAFDIIMRFIMQDLPTLVVQPYLTQNIKRKKLVSFLNVRSLFSIFIFLPLFIFLPFIFSVIGAKYGSGVSWAMAITIISLTFFNHFLMLFVKRKTILSQWWLIGLFVTVLLVGTADYFQIFSLRNWSASLFTNVLKNPALCFIFLAFAIAAWFNNNRFLYYNFYLENLQKSKAAKKSTEYVWLQKFGTYGDLIAIDLKLILRNKRPRMLLILSVIFLFYGYIFFKPENFKTDSLGILLLGSIFVTGMFVVSFGQYLFAWQSSYFDGLMAGNVQVKTYIKSKLMLLIFFSTISFLLCLLYGLLNWILIPILIAAWLFNIGVHVILTAFIGTYNFKGLDLSRGSTFNYQGVGAAQWLYSLIILIVGVIIYLPFALLINKWAGIVAIGLAGLICLLMQEWWLERITIQFKKQKYKIMDGFRER